MNESVEHKTFVVDGVKASGRRIIVAQEAAPEVAYWTSYGKG